MSETQKQANRRTQYRTPVPRLYNVVIHNDDFTTMDFVVMLLMRIFHKSYDVAETLMLKVHHEGSAVAGTYQQDIARSKQQYAMDLARQNGFPLKLTVEEA